MERDEIGSTVAGSGGFAVLKRGHEEAFYRLAGPLMWLNGLSYRMAGLRASATAR